MPWEFDYTRTFSKMTLKILIDCLGLAAKGISGLISNGGTMRLVTSHILTERDYEALSSGFTNLQDLTQLTLLDFAAAMSSNQTLEKKIKSDYVSATLGVFQCGD